MIRVFVYGTLKPDETNYSLCRDLVISAQEAIVQAELYHLALGYPAIVPGNGQTYGVLLTFGTSEILGILDDYEQHDSEVEPGNEYERQEIEIFNLDLQSLEIAWAYVMDLKKVDRLTGVLIPSGIWTSKK